MLLMKAKTCAGKSARSTSHSAMRAGGPACLGVQDGLDVGLEGPLSSLTHRETASPSERIGCERYFSAELRKGKRLILTLAAT